MSQSFERRSEVTGLRQQATTRGSNDASARAAIAVVEPAVKTLPTPAVSTNFLKRAIENFAVQDALVGVYLLLLLFALAVGNGPNREQCAWIVVADLTFFLAAITITRGGVLRQGSFANSLVYRLAVFLPVFLSYFQLKQIAPAVTTRAVDADLVAFDLRVFGVEPSLAWDRYVNPHTTEWFAFFYFGYFFLLSAHVLPMMLNASNRFRLAHFSLGILFICCVGHIVYLIVPGWGPYRHLAEHFEHPLEGGLFWGLVKATVEAGGSLKDIFPSIHTAIPSYFAMFSYMHRRAFPFRYTWPILAFSSTQIIGATMFLRWHYLIDIIAGLTLAATAVLLSHRVVTWETMRRKEKKRPPIFTLLHWPRARRVH